ncbi:MAG TPA: MarR family transcriptional regulator [Gemmatimonadaceae bacterium]|nr:MarR family transcriptional regulator [Gemmatimonadaceae bacterium]
MTGAALRQLDPESSLAQDDHEALRLWLRLFTTTTMVERVVDSTLKREFGSSLPRFDLLSQLYRAPDGLRMGELSERILVTNGNVTWLVAALEREGYVKRRPGKPRHGRPPRDCGTSHGDRAPPLRVDGAIARGAHRRHLRHALTH